MVSAVQWPDRTFVMQLSILSEADQMGLRNWSEQQYGDRMALDGIHSIPAAWAWLWFVLREVEDRPEWFPHGKSAILQVIEASLRVEAQTERPVQARSVSGGEE